MLLNFKSISLAFIMLFVFTSGKSFAQYGCCNLTPVEVYIEGFDDSNGVTAFNNNLLLLPSQGTAKIYSVSFYNLDGSDNINGNVTADCELLQLGVNSGSITRGGVLFENYSPLTVAVNELSKTRGLEQYIFNIGESGIMYSMNAERPSWNVADVRYQTFRFQWELFVEKLRQECKYPVIRAISITNGTNDAYQDNNYGSIAAFCTNGNNLISAANSEIDAQFGVNFSRKFIWKVNISSIVPKKFKIRMEQDCLCNSVGAICLEMPNWASPDGIHQDEATTISMANILTNILQ